MLLKYLCVISIAIILNGVTSVFEFELTASAQFWDQRAKRNAIFHMMLLTKWDLYILHFAVFI